jgi:O-antigen/teichoic acid export membrane protein
MTTPLVNNRLVARNSILNLAGQAIPLVVGVLSIPFVIHGLGVDTFGILSLAWMLLGYFTVFDLGLGRATTNFLARELGNGMTERLRILFWTSSGMNLLLGVVGAVAIAALSPLLAESVFRIPPGLTGAAKGSFVLIAVSCPIVLVSTAFRGALEAAQRFDFVNAVAMISSSLTFVLPVAGILAGLGIQGIIVLLVISRFCSALAYLFLCFRVFPILKQRISFESNHIKELLSYGGWITVSNLVNPLLVYLDRFVIGSMISIAAVSYYVAPYEMVTRLWILPASLTMTLFPTFSRGTASDRESTATLYGRSVKALLLAMGPLIAVLIFYAREILLAWLGSTFAETSENVFRILALGVFLNSLAQVSYALIQGSGRPDITAKFHLIEFVVYVPLVWFLVHSMGIVGGALAWTIRVAMDSLLLFAASGKYIDLKALVGTGLKRGIIVVALLACALFGSAFFQLSVLAKALLTLSVLAVAAFTAWRFVFDEAERVYLASAAHSVRTLGKGLR